MKFERDGTKCRPVECLLESRFLISVSQHGVVFLSENVHIFIYLYQGVCVYIWVYVYTGVYL